MFNAIRASVVALVPWLIPPASVWAAMTGTAAAVIAAIFWVPPYLWIPLGVLVAISVLLVVRLLQLSIEWFERREISPIEIIFDAINPQKKFWSVVPIVDVDGKTIGSQWEYRAIIKNNARKTIRNVKAVVEAIGPMPTMPEPALFHIGSFDTERKFILDLSPKEEALAIIRRWYNPNIVQGMVCGEDVYGPIKMTVNADDVPPKTQFFHFDPEKIPAVYL